MERFPRPYGTHIPCSSLTLSSSLLTWSSSPLSSSTSRAGQTYYRNKVTGTTQWNRPKEPAIPSGWETGAGAESGPGASRGPGGWPPRVGADGCLLRVLIARGADFPKAHPARFAVFLLLKNS